MSTSTQRTSARDSNTFGQGVSIFAGATMAIAGACQVLAGLVAVIDGNKFFVTTSGYAFEFNVTTWGWIHLVVGALAAITGVALFGGSLLARTAGIALACLSVLTNFLWLPYYPLWSLVVIAIDVFVIWALTTSSLADR